MAAVLQAASRDAGVASRYNIYRVIHKGLRGFMADTLLRIGRMDANDDCERGQAIEQLRGLLGMCMGHLHHENDFVHPAIEAAMTGGAKQTAADHVEHVSAIRTLEEKIAQVPSDRTWRLLEGIGRREFDRHFIAGRGENAVLNSCEKKRLDAGGCQILGAHAIDPRIATLELQRAMRPWEGDEVIVEVHGGGLCGLRVDAMVPVRSGRFPEDSCCRRRVTAQNVGSVGARYESDASGGVLPMNCAWSGGIGAKMRQACVG
jgi:hypothetical protein